jgi:hypothetical protein
MVLRKLPGPKREGVTGEWRNLQNEEPHYLYPSPNIIRVINSRRMLWVGRMSRRSEYVRKGCSWENVEEGAYSGVLGIDEKIILNEKEMA